MAPLWPNERQVYAQINIIMRQCQSCGLEQNHCGDDEIVDASDAAQAAPASGYWTDKGVNPPVRCEICGARDCVESHRIVQS